MAEHMRDKIANWLRLMMLSTMLLVGACSQTPITDFNVPSPSPEISIEPASPTDSFLSDLRQSQADLEWVDDETLFTAGETTCAVFDEGYAYEDALKVMLKSGLDPKVGVRIIQASAEYLCPEHNWMVN